LSKKDLGHTSTVLASAFSNDPIIKAMNLEVKEIKLMYEIPIRSCLRYGEVLASSDNLEGIMAFCPGKYANINIWNVIRSGALIPSLKLMKRLKPMQKITEVLEEDKKNLKIGPYIYLFVLGVSQESQGKGFGGKLLRALIEKAENERKPIYLETETEGNVNLYEKFGFEVMKQITLPILDLPMWEMVRYNS
jgi:predicted GNAT family N-acyltransferase